MDDPEKDKKPEDDKKVDERDEINKRMEKMEGVVKTQSDQIEVLAGKNEALQDSLDSALEDLALSGKAPEAGLDEPPANPVPAESAPPVEGGKEVPPETPPAEGTESKEPVGKIENEIEAAIEEDQRFREDILLKEGARDIKEDLEDALDRYPDANADEILLGVEDGIGEDNPDQIFDLAKSSQDKILAERETMRTSLKEELQGELKKEDEGGIKVPQSPGTPQAPQAPPASGSDLPPGIGQEDAEWGDAIKKAKAEGGGV